jgi:hypothetical protein
MKKTRGRKSLETVSLSGQIHVDGFFRSIDVDDGIFRHPHVLGLRNAWLL